MEEGIMDLKVGALARENFAYIQLFIKYHIDFYCHGKLTLKEALEESDADRDAFENDLEKVQNGPAQSYRVRIGEWPLDLLADYIQKTHHRYTEKTMGELKTMVENYLGSQRENTDVMKQFQPQFVQLMQELAVHMKKEEFLLFPFIRKRASGQGNTGVTTGRNMEDPIEMFTHEHEIQHQLLAGIRKTFHSYKLEIKEDKAFNDIMMLMQNLDEDLALHLHLENNILFPETLKLE